MIFCWKYKIQNLNYFAIKTQPEWAWDCGFTQAFTKPVFTASHRIRDKLNTMVAL